MKGVNSAKLRELIERYHPDKKIRTVNSGNLLMICPFHDDKDPSLYINLEKGFVKCFGNCQYYTRDLIKFLQDITQEEDVLPLLEELGIEIDNNSYKIHVEKQLFQSLLTKIADSLNAILRECLNNLNLAEEIGAKDALEFLKYRQISLNFTHLLPIGIGAPWTIIKEYGEFTPEEISFYEDPANNLNISKYSGQIAFFYGNGPRNVVQIQFRKPFNKDFSRFSFKKLKEPGLFGLTSNWYYSQIFKEEGPTVVVVEGEFDQLRILTNQIETGDTSHIAVALGGISQPIQNVIDLVHPSEIILFPDHEPGNRIFGAILNHIKNYNSIKIAEYPEDISPDIKCDPDELILKKGFDIYLALINSAETSVSYLKKHLDRLSDEELSDNLETILRTFVNIFENPIYRSSLRKYLAERLEVNETDLISGGSGIKNEEEFINILAKLFLDRFHIIDYDDSKNILRVYDTKQKVIKEIKTKSDRSISNSVKLAVGNLRKWIETNIGELPDWLVRPKGKALPYEAIDKRLSFFIKEAIYIIVNDSPKTSVVEMHVQGFNFVAPDKGYLVNGMDVFKFDYAKDRLPKLLPGPSDGELTFRIENEKWLKWVNSTRDLEMRELNISGENIKHLIPYLNKIESVYQELAAHIYNMLMHGWKFDRDSLDAFLLTMFIMAIPISDVFKHKSMVMLTGKKSSGKSTLAMGLVSGDQFPSIHLVEASTGNDNYTAAGIKQTAIRTRNCLVLDEFEIKKGKSSEEKARILEMFRGIISGSSTVVRGTVSDIPIYYVMRNFILFSGINIPHEAPDLTRMVIITLKHDPSRIPPEIAITDLYSQEEIDSIRKALTINMYYIASDIYHHQEEVDKILKKLQHKLAEEGVRNLSRISHAIYPMFTVASYLGFDAEQFFKDYVTRYAWELEARFAEGETDRLIKTILHTKAILDTLSEKHVYRTISYLLAHPEKVEMINKGGVGVYFWREKSWLIIHIPQAVRNILRGTEYEEASTIKIKGLLSRDPRYITEDIFEAKGGLEFLKKYIGVDLDIKEISALYIEAIASSVNEGDRPGEVDL